MLKTRERGRMPNSGDHTLELRRFAHRNATYCYAQYVTLRRLAKRYRARLRLVAFLGISVPLAAGTLLTGFEKLVIKDEVKWTVGLLGFLQAMLTAWALVAKWDDVAIRAQAAADESLELADAFKDLGMTGPHDIQSRYDDLQKRSRAPEKLLSSLDATSADHHRGNREALFIYAQNCGVCKRTPQSVKPPLWLLPWNRCDGCLGPIRLEV